MDRSLRPATSRRHGTGVPIRPGGAPTGCPLKLPSLGTTIRTA